MSESLDPSGSAITVDSSVTLRTPGLTGEAIYHAPAVPGTRSQPFGTQAFEGALSEASVAEEEAVEIEADQEPPLPGGTRAADAQRTIELEVDPPPADQGQFVLHSDESGVITWSFAPAQTAALEDVAASGGKHAFEEAVLPFTRDALRLVSTLGHGVSVLGAAGRRRLARSTAHRRRAHRRTVPEYIKRLEVGAAPGRCRPPQEPVAGVNRIRSVLLDGACFFQHAQAHTAQAERTQRAQAQTQVGLFLRWAAHAAVWPTLEFEPAATQTERIVDLEHELA